MSFNKQNILVIDNDESINYQKSVIDNKCDLLPDLEETINLVHKRANNLFSENTIKCFSVIDESGQNIAPCNYHDEKIVFFKMADDILRKNNCEIFYSPDFFRSDLEWKIDKNSIYQSSMDNYKVTKSNADIDKACNRNIDGYENCISMLNQSDFDIGNFPVLNFCVNQQVKIGNDIYQGYVPSIKQLSVFLQCFHLIDIFAYRALNQFATYLQYSLWSSTEFDEYAMWILSWNGHKILRHKQNKCPSSPFFKKITNNEK